MLASWMLYSVVIGVLLSAAAAVMERGLRSLGRPTRWAWAGATALTLAIPLAPWLVHAVPPTLDPTPVRVAPDGVGSIAALPTRMRSAPRALDLARWDAPLRLAWGGSSLAVVMALCAMGVVLARRRRAWTATEVDGVPVLVSEDTGPAVVGLLRARIVLPAWALAADDEARRLVLEHEQEHVRAGDPRLLAAALLAAALMPWNPAVWWQLRRLRLAVEVDCDARVLRRRGDVRAYGSVLLEMGRRASHTRLAAAAFADPVSTLERRIRIMTAPRAHRPVVRAVAFTALACALVAAACETPGPMQPLGGDRVPVAGEAEPQGAPRTKVDIRAMIARYFPEVARDGLPQGEWVYFIVSPEGQVVRHARRAAPSAGYIAGYAAGFAAAANQARLAAIPPRFHLEAFGVELTAVRSIDYMPQPAGAVAPTPVNVVWVQLKSSGEGRDTPGDSAQVSSQSSSTPPVPAVGRPRVSNGIAPKNPVTKPDKTQMHGTGIYGPGGVGGFATELGPESRTSADHTQLREAIRRFYTPELKAAGVSGFIEIRYSVGADGRAHDIDVRGATPALMEIGRNIVESLTFISGPSERPHTLLVGVGVPPSLRNR